MSINEDGIIGEKLARQYLQTLGLHIFQVDWIAEKNGQYAFYEIKYKERFTAPPFDGHGLERRQFERRLKAQQDIGIRSYLLVFEKGTNKVFGQWFDILNNGESLDTANGIVIFPLTSFRELEFTPTP